MKEEEEKNQTGRLRSFFKKILVWLIVFVIAFIAGVVTDYYLRYKPLSSTLAETEEALDQASKNNGDLQDEIDDLDSAIQEANDKISSLEADKVDLQIALETAVAHRELLHVLVDVNNARLALFRNDVGKARTTLLQTAARLDDLLLFIAKIDADLAQSMQQRLDLIISGLEVNTENAVIDLDLFIQDLLTVETEIFIS